MVYIFMDESGDLGFHKRSSRWFIFTIVGTEDIRKLEKTIKKVRKNLVKKYKHKYSELHAYHTDEITRKRLLKMISGLDIFITTIVVNKKHIPINLREQKHDLYNRIANALLERFFAHTTGVDDFRLIIDRKDTNKSLRNAFIVSLNRVIAKHNAKGVPTTLARSYDEKGLQAIDFISWAIFQKYERERNDYYGFIKDKIIDEHLLFP